MQKAPFRRLPTCPWPEAEAWWISADDDCRLRVGLWRPDTASLGPVAAWLDGSAPAGPAQHEPAEPLTGSVLLFPGRTEYLEKYAPVAAALTGAGLHVLGIDWRGQGASDRSPEYPMIGHIRDFGDYRRDVAALAAAAEAVDLPRPWRLLAHSMGGCIGLRALHDGLPVVAAAFSAPMWGIRFGKLPDSLGASMARGLANAAGRAGRGERAVPGIGSVLDIGFNANELTGDLPEYIRFMTEAAAWPDLMLGPASYDWVRAALAECRTLATLPAPDLPALITVSGAEAIVSPAAIRATAEKWPRARLLTLPGARHEALFEVPATRRTTLSAIIDLLRDAPYSEA